MSDDCLTAALRYAKQGWRVFPLQGKKPYPNTNGFHDATTDRKQIRQWWKKWPDANVGIACDSQHGPIVVDADSARAVDYLDSLELFETREASSGKKEKRHYYYEGMLDSTEIGRFIRPFKVDGVKIEIDILGDGGYVVAPPSIHPETGRRYRWTNKKTARRFPKKLFNLLRKSRRTDKKSAAPPLPSIIEEGERDNLLTSMAGTMRRRGAEESTILAALRDINDTRLAEPLADKDLVRISKSISRKEPVLVEEHLTDLGNARRFIAQHSDRVRAVMSSRRPWYIWDDQRWTPDITGEVDRMAKQTVRRIYQEASSVADEEKRDAILKHAAKSESAPRIRAMLELAATEPELITRTEQWDANPWRLNVMNGTIDLRTGKLHPHNREHLITKLVPIDYDPKAKCPKWEQFVLDVTEGDEELVRYIQQAIGYTLTGDTREQCLFFLYGSGSNGKTTFLEIIRNLLGEYARQSDFGTFLSNRGDGPRNDLARMHGARLVTASEADGEKGFDTRIVKLLSGDDTIVARKLYEEFTEFKPQHKLFLAANHKPIVKEQTVGFWRRMRLIPFCAMFTKDKRDKRLPAKLRNEISGVLNWAIAGCLDWKKNGLIEPQAVVKATRGYKEENDLLGEFLAEVCTIGPDEWVSTTVLYRSFTDWYTDTRGPRSQPISIGWMGRLLGERPEFRQKKMRRTRGWKGLNVKTQMRIS